MLSELPIAFSTRSCWKRLSTVSDVSSLHVRSISRGALSRTWLSALLSSVRSLKLALLKSRFAGKRSEAGSTRKCSVLSVSVGALGVMMAGADEKRPESGVRTVELTCEAAELTSDWTRRIWAGCHARVDRSSASKL